MQTIVTDDPSINLGYESCVIAIAGTFADHMDLQNLQDLFGFPGGPSATAPTPASARSRPIRRAVVRHAGIRQPRQDIFAIGLEAAGEYAFYSFDYRGRPERGRSVRHPRAGRSPRTIADGRCPLHTVRCRPRAAGPVAEPGTLLLALAGLFVLTARRRGEARGTT